MARKKHLGRGLSALIPTDPVVNQAEQHNLDTASRPADIFFGGHASSPKGGSARELLEPRKNVSRETSRPSSSKGTAQKGKSSAARVTSDNAKKQNDGDRLNSTNDVSRETSLVEFKRSPSFCFLALSEVTRAALDLPFCAVPLELEGRDVSRETFLRGSRSSRAEPPLGELACPPKKISAGLEAVSKLCCSA